MGWSFRKSTSFGPFRVNFSKSGLGLSFGIKGARISVSKRGTYVNLGANGIYYRQRLDTRATNDGDVQPPPPNESLPQGDTLHTITTSSIESFTDVDSKAFINELETKASRRPLLQWLGIWPSVALFLYLLSFANDIVTEYTTYKTLFIIGKDRVLVRSASSKESEVSARAIRGDKFEVTHDDTSKWVNVYLDKGRSSTGYIHKDMGTLTREVANITKLTRIQQYSWLRYCYLLAAVVMLTWCFYLYRIDQKRKTIEIYYTFDEQVTELHKQFLQCFKTFASSSKIWQSLHISATGDKKYHGGASLLVSRVAVGGIHTHKVPLLHLKTNATIPCIVLKNTELYFFPERLIIKRGNKFGAAFYKNISIEQAQSNFIESETLPSDAVVVDYTWKYLNKSGGPDRRFSDNQRLPVCRYSEYTFKSDSGLFEAIMTSKIGAMDQFAKFLEIIGDYQKRMN